MRIMLESASQQSHAVCESVGAHSPFGRWPCRTNADASLEWRHMHKAMISGRGSWHVLYVECDGVEMPIPYNR